MAARPSARPQLAAAEPTDAMVDAYLQAQRRTVEEADRFGRPNVGGLHANTVREACRAGLQAAIAAAVPQPAASTLPTPPQPCRPDLLERLTFHQLERDDLTIDECLSYLSQRGWKEVHGRTDREMVMQILALLAAAPAAPAAMERTAQPLAMFRNVQWPKAREVGRIGDMSLSSAIRVGFDADNDVYVSVHDEHGSGSIEFCTPSSGGGKSSRTREALIALMVAIEADNTEAPAFDWWAKRMSGSGNENREPPHG